VDPLAQLTLALDVIALALGGIALVLSLRGTPHALAARLADVEADSLKLRAAVETCEASVERQGTRVTGFIEEANELLSRIETKRRRTVRAAQVLEQEGEAAAPVNELDQARQRARSMGFNV
jgi:hypothetical protein